MIWSVAEQIAQKLSEAFELKPGRHHLFGHRKMSARLKGRRALVKLEGQPIFDHYVRTDSIPGRGEMRLNAGGDSDALRSMAAHPDGKIGAPQIIQSLIDSAGQYAPTFRKI